MATEARRFQVTGMTCGHCIAAVTRAVRDVDDTAEVAIDLVGGMVTIHSAAASERLAQAIESEGYGVSALDGQRP